jgi:hypothetical protein
MHGLVPPQTNAVTIAFGGVAYQLTFVKVVDPPAKVLIPERQV